MAAQEVVATAITPKMTPAQKTKLTALLEDLQTLEDEVHSNSIPGAYLATKQYTGTYAIEADAWGCLYLAGILLGLAEKASPNQHFHFDDHTLDTCEWNLVVQFKNAPREHSKKD